MPKRTINKSDLYYKSKKSFFELLPDRDNEIIFVGDSMIDRCNWGELFDNVNIKNRGISGDNIEGVINRLDELVSSKPSKIFLMIGVNDLKKFKNTNKVLEDYERLSNMLSNKSPETKTYLHSILPTYNITNRNNDSIVKINEGIQRISNKYNFTFIDINEDFKNRSGELDTIYSFDGLHLNGLGYQIWKSAIKNEVNNIQ